MGKGEIIWGQGWRNRVQGETTEIGEHLWGNVER